MHPWTPISFTFCRGYPPAESVGCIVLLKVSAPCSQAPRSSLVVPAPAGQHRPPTKSHVNPAARAVPSAVLHLRARNHSMIDRYNRSVRRYFWMVAVGSPRVRQLEWAVHVVLVCSPHWHIRATSRASMPVPDVICGFPLYIVPSSLTFGCLCAGRHICAHVARVIVPKTCNASRFHCQLVHALL